MSAALTTLFWLLVAHALCDYAGQGDFQAAAKNHRKPIPGVPPSQALVSHALIHGGGVALSTGSVALGVLETLAHTLIDYGKCDGWFGEGARAFHIDQALHVACKVAWLALLLISGAVR